jgi:hypothetical protein
MRNVLSKIVILAFIAVGARTATATCLEGAPVFPKGQPFSEATRLLITKPCWTLDPGIVLHRAAQKVFVPGGEELVLSPWIGIHPVSGDLFVITQVENYRRDTDYGVAMIVSLLNDQGDTIAVPEPIFTFVDRATPSNSKHAETIRMHFVIPPHLRANVTGVNVWAYLTKKDRDYRCVSRPD